MLVLSPIKKLPTIFTTKIGIGKNKIQRYLRAPPRAAPTVTYKKESTLYNLAQEDLRMNTRKVGKENESQAVQYLKSLGYQIIEINWHCSKLGEIDIIAKDPSRYGKEYWIFVEVKYRARSMEMSLNAINSRKITQIVRLAKYFILGMGLNLHRENISFDFIAIHDGEIQHLKDIVR